MFCKNCGAEVHANQDVCLNCGCKLKDDQLKGYLNGQNKIVMILICLFLGSLGVHNFMMGEIKKGLFRLILTCCCSIGCIFALIDLVKICMGTYVVDKEALV